MAWTMHAGWDEEQQQFEDFGHPQYVRAHGHTEVVPVRLTEGGEYWAWLGNDGAEPLMVYRREVLFRVCFPYGAEEEERAGRGRVIRLSVERLTP